MDMSRNLLVTIISMVIVSGIVLADQGIGLAKIMVDYQKGGVELSWTEPTQRITEERLLSSEIAGYNIFRSLIGENDYRKINQELIRQTRYLDRHIEWGKCYSYALTTVDYRGLESPRSPIVQAVAPLAPPAKVEAFGQKRSVRLSWEKSNNPQIRGYNIYRSEISGQNYQVIASVLDTDDEYLDQKVEVGKNYYYLLSTVDLSWQESAFSPEVGATPLVISQEELSTLEKIDGFRADIDHEGESLAVILHWEPVTLENLAGYSVYRRLNTDMGKGPASYQRLNKELIRVTNFRDEEVVPQQSYFYLIAAVDKDNNEARFPREISITVAELAINSLTDDSSGRPLKGGKLLTITLTGTPGKKASASLEGLAQDIPLQETDQEGVYYGQYSIPEGISKANIALTGTIEDDRGEKIGFVSSGTVTIDNTPPAGILAATAELVSDAVHLSWELPDGSDDVVAVRVFRSLADNEGNDSFGKAEDCARKRPGEAVSGEISPRIRSFDDRSFRPHQGYYYYLITYDQAGNESWSQDCLAVITPVDSTPPKIHSVEELSAPGTKRLGDVIRIQMLGEPRAEGRFSIGPRIRQPFQEVSPGKYQGEYTVQAGDDLENEPVMAELTDASENRSTMTGNFKISIDTRTEAGKPPQIAVVEHNAFSVAGMDPLVAGDSFRISVQGDPGCTAYVDIGALVTRSGPEADVELSWEHDNSSSARGEGFVTSYRIYSQPEFSSSLIFLPGSQPSSARLVKELPPGATCCRIEDYHGGYLSVTARKNTGDEQIILTPKMHIPLTEVQPGLYEGTYKIQPGDRVREGKLTAYLVNRQGEVSLPHEAEDAVSIDTSVAVTVTPREKCLKADGKSKTEVRIEVSNARQVGVADREIVIELFTTDEYTGIAGVGRFDEDKYGYVDNSYQLVTDPGGMADIPYVSGLAAKTVIIRAKDVATGCVGLSYITSYIEGLINIQLIDPPARQRLRALQSGPSLTVWADNEWLTADGGHSRTIVHARVLDAEGNPLGGHRLSFAITSGEGRIEEIQPITTGSGEALARYFAGKHVGTVEITAVDTVTGMSRKVYIILKSDAPAKIVFEGTPLSIYADGASTSDLTIQVADMNDNPSRGIPLEVDIIQGKGRLIALDKELVTDFQGECRLKYLAGTKPETVTIRARALSAVPDPQTMQKARIAEKGMN